MQRRRLGLLNGEASESSTCSISPEEHHWRISRAAVLEEGYHSFQITELNGFCIPRLICLWWKLSESD